MLSQKVTENSDHGTASKNIGITAEDFKWASAFVSTKFDGAWRPIALKTEIESALENQMCG